MKHLQIIIFISSILPQAVFAGQTHYDLMGSVTHFNYNETVESQFFMKDEGALSGLFLSRQQLDDEHHGWQIDFAMQGGEIDYTSNGTGTMSNITDTLTELRIHYLFPLNNRWHQQWLGRVGIGGRWLIDQSGGKYSSTGHAGYDRISEYAYLPVGIDAPLFEHYGWGTHLSAEYDYFLKGTQQSYILAPTNPMVNDQEDGYGLKAAVRFNKKTINKMRILFEPYFNYWHIEPSTVNCQIISFDQSFCGREPENSSREIGIRFGVGFNGD